MNYHSLTIEQTLQKLQSSQTNGLSSKEAVRRLKKYGPNQLEEKKATPLWKRFFRQFADFMILILILSAIISFAVSYLEGKTDFIDPIIIFTIIILNAAIGTIQEAKAEKSLAALKKMSAPTATVLRDGNWTILPSCELVPGDIVSLETGYLIPGDARLLTSVNLKVDESALTGESIPVSKDSSRIYKKNTPLGDRKNMVPSTGIVTYGRGTAIITATGMNTEVGHIAHLIMKDEAPMTPLQKRLSKTGKVLGIAALLICIILFFLGTIQGRPVFEMFMTSVSLGVAAIPEGLPAVITIMLSLGVQRMAKKNAVIRKLPAVETLGSATVICSDKTGTLTQNKMTVTMLSSYSKEEAFDSSFAHFLLEHAVKCSDTIIQVNQNETTVLGDPTEIAITLAAQKINISKSKLELSHPRVYEIPFDSIRKTMTIVEREDSGYLCICKGAFDYLLPKCTYIYDNGKSVPLSDSHKKALKKQNELMGNRALRVIAVAYQHADNYAESTLEKGYTFIGLIGMIDPPRPEVKDAVWQCKESGIRPVMITGDHVITASAIGKELGILTDDNQAITGKELSLLSDKELEYSISHFSVFARVSPEHKVRIVKAFQKNGNVVAMTGDGVNDAPALKTADIGCAMGLTGTDVAKNAADMILTDDNFTTIVSAVREGRGIYDNIQKSIHFLLSSNIGEILTIFTAILFRLSSPLLAIHLLWVNLVTDSLPAICLGMEPPDKDIMKRPPIPAKKGLFSDGLVFKIIFEGMLIGFLALIAFITGYHSGEGNQLELGRTMCFSVLALSQLCHSFNMRSRHSLFTIGICSNPWILFSFLLCAGLQIVVIMYPPLRTIFHVTALNLHQWLWVAALSAIPIGVVELQKFYNHTQTSFTSKK